MGPRYMWMVTQYLKVLSTWSWSRDWMMKHWLYHDLICSKMNYGSFIYFLTITSQLSVLDTVHYTRICLATGILYTTSVKSICGICRPYSLLVESVYPSLQLCSNAVNIAPTSIICYGLSLYPLQWVWAEYHDLYTCECLLSPSSRTFIFSRLSSIPPKPLTCPMCNSQVVKRMRGQTSVFTKKNGVFWDVTPCGSCKNRRFGGI
jgi:hypothetical protein